MRHSITLGLLVLVTLASCESGGNDKPVKPMSLSPAEIKIIDKTNDFAFDLLEASYEEAVKNNNKVNHVISPLSAAMVIAMLENGTDGAVREEILNTLGFEADEEAQMNEFYKRMLKELPKRSKSSKVKLANAGWLNQQYPIDPEYENAMQKYYDANIENCIWDDKTVNRINKWCSKQTDGNIKEIVNLNMFGAETVYAALSALYFKSNWKDEFKKSDTRPDKFYGVQEYTTKFMHQNEHYMYSENELFRMLEIDYKNQAYCMDFILPNGTNTINDVVDKLDDEMFEEALSGQRSHEANVAIPLMKLEYNIELNDALINMGMHKAFSGGDFTRLCPILKTGLISLVEQRTFLEINEKGTKAAAITLGMTGVGAPGPQETIDFKVNKPFIIVLRERQSNIILFTGVINHP